MAGHVEQAELPLVRARVPLEDDDDLMPVRLRVPKAVAAVVEGDPASAIRALAKASEVLLAKISETNMPVGQAVIDGQLRTMPAGSAESRQGWPANENPEMYTGWFIENEPHWKGFYDVTDHASGTLSARWWFGGVWWQKGDPREAQQTGVTLTRLSHEQFKTQYAWRGLREGKANWPYFCPPYNAKELPAGAASQLTQAYEPALEFLATPATRIPLEE